MIKKLKRVCAMALLSVASIGVAEAGQFDGFWLPDMALTKEKLTATDPGAWTTICRRIAADGFYVLSLFVTLEIDGKKLRVRSIGGGLSQSAELQSRDGKTGALLFRSPSTSAEKLMIEITPQPLGAIRVRWASPWNAELNSLQWVRKSKDEIERMDENLLKDGALPIEDVIRPCEE